MGSCNLGIVAQYFSDIGAEERADNQVGHCLLPPQKLAKRLRKEIAENERDMPIYLHYYS